MREKEEAQTNKEQTISQKADGIITKEIRGKTFVTETYFDKNSKDTFPERDKLGIAANCYVVKEILCLLSREMV